MSLENNKRLEFTYDVFGNRVPNRVERNTHLPAKAEWKMSTQELIDQLSDALRRIAPEYDNQPTQETTGFDKTMAEIENLHPHLSLLERRELVQETHKRKKQNAAWRIVELSADPSVICTVRKQSYPFREEPGEVRESIAINIEKNGRSVMDIGIDHVPGSNTWELSHRIVFSEFRENGIFSAALKAVEVFVQAYATKKREQQNLTLSSGQPMLIARLLRKEFKSSPKVTNGENQRERIDKILSGHESLYCDYQYGKFGAIAEEDLYVYEDTEMGSLRNDKETKQKERAYRVELEKAFNRQMPEVSSHQTHVKTMVDDVLKQGSTSA